MTSTENAISLINSQSEYFERAISFVGRARERLVALTEAEQLCNQLHPCGSLQIIRMASQPGIDGDKSRLALHKCENRLLFLITRLIGDAAAFGDLPKHGAPNPRDLAHALWAIAFRNRWLMNLVIPEAIPAETARLQASTNSGVILLDAIGWQPLSTEWDYEHTRQRVRQEVFAEECTLLANPDSFGDGP